VRYRFDGMKIRVPLLRALTCAAVAVAVAACSEQETGPVEIAAIGSQPRLADPNAAPLDPPSALVLEGAAQGLVRFNAEGEIEPALAQSWIVSDDGLRYTFRIRRTEWSGGGRVTAAQVVARLRAVSARTSRNPLKPILGLVDGIEAMTDEVLEITLKGPRDHFLQLLASPEMAILQGQSGTGPFRPTRQPDGSVLLSLPAPEDEPDDAVLEPPIALRGERASAAIARFASGAADLVTGGTAGDLPIVRAAEPAAATLRFDPVGGLFGLVFQRNEGPFAEAQVRRALAMSVDRDAIVSALGVPGAAGRSSLLPGGLEEVPSPAAPDWATLPLPTRRQAAAATLAGLREAGSEDGVEAEPLRLRVAMPDGLGYRLIFAFLRRDWRAIGVEAERVAPSADADLRFVDEVAPATMAAWYLRHFTCEASRICDSIADESLAAARLTPVPAERRALLAKADRALAELAVFVPISAPARWSLVSPRLTGFRVNSYARHSIGELIAIVR
jgi:peptide/nickel transport system substrate-binding protein